MPRFLVIKMDHASESVRRASPCRWRQAVVCGEILRGRSNRSELVAPEEGKKNKKNPRSAYKKSRLFVTIIYDLS
jgi:hypothetical protein